MNWPNRSARLSPTRTILLVILALLAGSFAGTFFMDDGSAGPDLPTEMTAGGDSVEEDGVRAQATPAVLATESGLTSSTVGATATPRTGAPAAETVALGATERDFTLPDLFEDDTTYTLSAYRGRPVILNFWASWCVPCRREMPALQATAARFEADGLLLLGMNQTYIDDLEAARAFVQELDLTFPNTRDDNGAVGREAYEVVGIPTTIFITREGEVVHIQIGEMSLEQITGYTEALIAGEPFQP